jgi:hypothetical protein
MSNAARWFASSGVVSACVALVVWPLASSAQTISEATADSLLRSPASVSPAAQAGAQPPPAVQWPQRRGIDLSSWRVVELPDEGARLGPPARKHHALTWRNDALSKALDNAGLAHADCHQRLRLPSRWRPSPNGGPAMQVQLQLAIGCSF